MAFAILLKLVCSSLIECSLRVHPIWPGDSVRGCVVVAGTKVKQDALSYTKELQSVARIIHSFGRQGFAADRSLTKLCHMDGKSTSDRVSAALARIDAAAYRIEAAAKRVRSERTGSDPELEARYAELQREAGEALQQLDRLLGAIER